MTYLGTRPILPDELEQYELHHRARIAIKPGITGMWQVSGRSDITDFEEIVRLDTEYISEGMPLSLLEAMSYGNCCLVSDIPECTEVVEDKALIFKKSDVSDLWEKLQDACNHPENVMELKKEAADFICKKYDWDDVVEKTRELYRRNKSVNIDDR